jgi:peptidoglycan/xylan/chitin deacetylase (PgdA/CDA1 family)
LICFITESEQCDWPENSLCQFDPDAVKPKQLNQKTFLYLTFDDGPNEGTNSVVDALASEDAKATFFINR